MDSLNRECRVGKRAAGAQLSRAGGQRTGFTSILGGARGLRITPSCTGLWPGGGRASKAGGGEDTGSSSSKSSSPYSSPMAAAACAGGLAHSRDDFCRRGAPGNRRPAQFHRRCTLSYSAKTGATARVRSARSSQLMDDAPEGGSRGQPQRLRCRSNDSEGVSLQASTEPVSLCQHCPAAAMQSGSNSDLILIDDPHRLKL